MILGRVRFALFLSLLLLSAPSWAGEDKVLDRLILNGGETIHVELTHTANDILIITHGKAERVPDETGRANRDANTVELDVNDRSFALKTSARQLFISGAKSASIAGIGVSNWGNFDRPAIFVDRDCRVILKGKAVQSAVIEVHPLAIAAIDARGLETKEIVIIGNARTNVQHRPGTKVSFLKRENRPETRTSGSAGDWETTPDIATPAVTPQGQPPQPASPTPTPVPPSPTPGQEKQPVQP